MSLFASLLFVHAASQAVAETKLAALDQARAAQERRLANDQAPLAELLAAAQRLALQPPALALARPDAATEIMRTRALLATLGPEIAARTAALRREMMAMQGLRARTEQALAALMTTRHGTDTAIKRLAVLAGPTDIAAMPAHSDVYRIPANGTVVVGMGDASEGGVRARGLTIATAPGATVAAPARGWIAYAGPFRGYGDIIILDHGHGWTTLLAGLGLATVEGGALVEMGEPLGHMGRDAPQLTIELRHGGQALDPVAMALQ